MSKDTTDKVSIKGNYLLILLVLFFLVGFFGGKIYTNYSINTRYECFYEEDLADICLECIDKVKFVGWDNSNIPFGDVVIDNANTNTTEAET